LPGNLEEFSSSAIIFFAMHAPTILCARARSFLRCRALVSAIWLAALLLAPTAFSDDSAAPEPSWQGKSLTDWALIMQGRSQVSTASDLLLEDETPTRQQNEARIAIREIGTNALPFLLTWLPTSQFAKSQFAFQALREIAAPAVASILHLARTGDKQVQERALHALGNVGPAARLEAEPFLMEQLEAGNLSAARSLALVGTTDPYAATLILQMLERDRTSWTQLELVKALGDLGRVAAAATGKLIAILNDTESVIISRSALEVALVRKATVEALGRIGDEQAIPVLIQLLEQNRNARSLSEISLRRAVMRALATFGPAAREALPILKVLSTSLRVTQSDRLIAAEARRKISPRLPRTF
jgi:HEAT repeat protein